MIKHVALTVSNLAIITSSDRETISDFARKMTSLNIVGSLHFLHK